MRIAKFLLLALFMSASLFAAERKCLLQLHTVTDRQFWVSGALPPVDLGRSGLSSAKIYSIIGDSKKPDVVTGRIYSYLANVKYDPHADNFHLNLQEKRIAFARDIFRKVDLAPWVVTEKRLSNGVHVFLGYSGHYMKVKADGSLSKGNLQTDIHEVTEDMLLNNSHDEEIFSLEKIE